MTAVTVNSPRLRAIAAALYRRRRLRLALLLVLPVIWLVGVYGGSLASLLTQSFFRLDSFAGTIDRTPTLDTWRELFTPANRAVMGRTIGMAAAVTVAAVVVALPLAYYIARYASTRVKGWMVHPRISKIDQVGAHEYFHQIRVESLEELDDELGELICLAYKWGLVGAK